MLVLAVVAVVQLLVTDGRLTGVGTFAPAFLVLALALLAARAAAADRSPGPPCGPCARAGSGVALAGFQLSRRPGAARLFTLLVAAVAVAGYAACAVDVAAQGRVVASELGIGADRVVTVGAGQPRPTAHRGPRRSTRTATSRWRPSGCPAAARRRPPGLALDTSRLAAVATWPAGRARPGRGWRRKLHPAAGPPVVFPGQDITLDVTGHRPGPGQAAAPAASSLSSVTGLGEVTVRLGDADRPGRSPTSSGCRDVPGRLPAQRHRARHRSGRHRRHRPGHHPRAADRQPAAGTPVPPAQVARRRPAGGCPTRASRSPPPPTACGST